MIYQFTDAVSPSKGNQHHDLVSYPRLRSTVARLAEDLGTPSKRPERSVKGLVA